MRVARALVSLLMMLWLPVQGVAAFAMPFCEHGFQPLASTGVTAQPSVHGSAQHAHHGEQSSSSSHQHHAADVGTHDRDGSPNGLACNDCGACHLACSPAVPASPAAVEAVGGQNFVQSSPTLPPLFIPEQRNRPPLAAIA